MVQHICSYRKPGVILLSCLLVWFSQVSADVGDSLVVSSDGSRLRSLPSTRGVVLQKLKRGDAVIEILRKKKWINVSIQGQGINGWIFHKSVKPLVQDAKRLQLAKKIQKKTSGISHGLKLSLAELGYKNGVLFEGSAANHARQLYFQVPQDMPTKRGLLRIHYRFSPLLEEHSNMRIFVNDSPRKVVRLKGNSHTGWLSVKLNRADLKKRFVQIGIKSAMLISKDRCFDERVGGAYLQILPDTSINWDLGNKITSIRSYWQLLPAKVVVSLPKGELNAELFRNALGLTKQLIRSGREVRFTRLPKMGDIVVAPRENVSAWLNAEYKDLTVANLGQAGKDNNLVLINLPDRQFLAVWGTHDQQSLSFLSDYWRSLAASSGYKVHSGSGPGELTEDSYVMKLKDLGMNTAAIEMARKASWDTTINPSQLPPGHRLNKVRVRLIAAPSTTDKPVMFYSYLNGVLIKAVRLEDTGETQDIILSLPQGQMERTNNLNFVAQRDISALDMGCTGEPMRFPIQIKPDSEIETILDDTVPERFANLPAYFAKGFDVYLPDSYLQQPERSLSFLASFMNDMDLPLRSDRLRFYQPKDKIEPGKPFILLGRAQTAFDKQSVYLDKGRIDVINQQGNVLLAVDALPKVSIAQIVRSNDAYGLWLIPPESGKLARISDMHLSQDDVAFADKNGVLLTLDSSQPGLSRVAYPDNVGWFELFGEYRFWYFAIAWLLLTSLIIYLYRLSKSHRKN
ncbi:MAG: cellulose biosynthesis cyclic di-GMP-binding regulatory protein BcsB [Gammaproteobacteria bacterium]|nr:cellulose biosynthesis cyclic di-GMP-binding regulatory protein BcsB [Gammaproteobacteria bacterium]